MAVIGSVGACGVGGGVGSAAAPPSVATVPSAAARSASLRVSRPHGGWVGAAGDAGSSAGTVEACESTSIRDMIASKSASRLHFGEDHTEPGLIYADSVDCDEEFDFVSAVRRRVTGGDG